MAMTAALREVVEASNPWLADPSALGAEAARRLPERLVPRAARTGLADVLGDDLHAHLVIGPRQAGKSTTLWSLVGEARGLLYLDCEERLVQAWCTSPSVFATEAAEFLPPGGVLFLEEAQSLPEAGRFLKGLVDRRTGWTILVTGSASFHLLSRTRESLAGRATRHRVWPLSLEEVGTAPQGAPPAALRRARRLALDRLLVTGGYPEVWTSQEPRRVLGRLVEAFVLRDASDRFRIARADAFRTMMHLAAGQVGDRVNRSEWASILGISVNTVADYLGILEETHIIAQPRPFAGGKRSELTSTPKLFFVDNGLRNHLAGGFDPLDRRADLGKLMENLVFSELHKRYPWPGQVRYWRTRNGAEVDFVLEPEPGRLIGIEVKARSGARPRLPRSARSFITAYEPEQLLMVHRGEPHEEQHGSTMVRWVPAELLPEALPPAWGP